MIPSAPSGRRRFRAKVQYPNSKLEHAARRRLVLVVVRIASADSNPQLADLVPEIRWNIGNRNSLLLCGVAIADGHSLILQRVIVDGEAIRRADFILAAIALADISSLIVFDEIWSFRLDPIKKGFRDLCELRLLH